MNVKKIMPVFLAALIVLPVIAGAGFLIFPGNIATRWRRNVLPLAGYGKIVLTLIRMRRRHGRAAGQARPQGGGAGRRAVPEPAPRAGHRPGVPGQRLLRRPGRGAGQVRDGAQGQGRRRPGHRGRRGVRVLPPRVLRRRRRAGILRAGRAGPRQARAARRQQAHRGDPRLGRGAAAPPGPALRPAQLPDRIADAFGVRVHPRSVEKALARRRERHSKSRGTARPRDAEGG